MPFYTYLLASQKNGTLNAGHTDNLFERITVDPTPTRPAKARLLRVSAKVHRLVWFESFETHEQAKTKEYQIKKWKRGWKIELIEETNPDWRDLYFDLNILLPF